MLKIELLISMLSKFEREVDLKDSDFWWVACLTQKAIMICILLDNKFYWLGLPYGLVYPVLVEACGWME